MSGIAAFIKRAQVLASSALSWLTAISAILVALAQQLEGVAGVPEWLTRVLASAIAVIAVIVLQVRRVTPVADADKGLLPPKGPAVEVLPAQARDAGQVSLRLLLMILAIVCLVVFTLAAHGSITTDEGMTWLGAGLVFWAIAEVVP